MNGINDGRVVVITGAGRGVGREYALEFARTGARVVVNDLGGGPDGTGASASPADEVVGEIRGLGGEAIASVDDVSDPDGSASLISAAIDTFGRLDVLVNNAGILRDRMLVNMSVDDWDAIMRVHLRGTFLPSKLAARYWRDEAKAGRTPDARLICTSSATGLFGNVGQANYGAAKAGIANFAITAAKELARYGVTSNAVWPAAMSRLTAGILHGNEQAIRELDPSLIAPVVAWLGSPQSRNITGHLIGLRGRQIIFAEGWVAGPQASTDTVWTADTLGPVMAGLAASTRASTDFTAGKADIGAS